MLPPRGSRRATRWCARRCVVSRSRRSARVCARVCVCAMCVRVHACVCVCVHVQVAQVCPCRPHVVHHCAAAAAAAAAVTIQPHPRTHTRAHTSHAPSSIVGLRLNDMWRLSCTLASRNVVSIASTSSGAPVCVWGGGVCVCVCVCVCLLARVGARAGARDRCDGWWRMSPCHAMSFV